MRHERFHLRRALLPILLIVLGISFLQGCLYIPTFNKPMGDDPSKKVGSGNSNKSIRVNVATRADVEHLLGPANSASRDETSLVYTWPALKGVWVYPFCFMSEDDQETRAIVMQFDDQGILR